MCACASYQNRKCAGNSIIRKLKKYDWTIMAQHLMDIGLENQASKLWVTWNYLFLVKNVKTVTNQKLWVFLSENQARSLQPEHVLSSWRKGHVPNCFWFRLLIKQSFTQFIFMSPQICSPPFLPALHAISGWKMSLHVLLKVYFKDTKSVSVKHNSLFNKK